MYTKRAISMGNYVAKDRNRIRYIVKLIRTLHGGTNKKYITNHKCMELAGVVNIIGFALTTTVQNKYIRLDPLLFKCLIIDGKFDSYNMDHIVS
jgi:hypothetical protein